WLSSDEACPFEGQHHLVNRGWADAEVLKYSCMSVSAGGRRCRRVYRWMKARYWPCLGVKVFPERLTPAIRFSCSSVPRSMDAQMNVRYRVELSQTERAALTALLSGGKHASRKLKRAQILLAADAGARDRQ